MNRVLKFGGSSVAGSEQINAVIDIVVQQPNPIVVVVSALGGITNQLKQLTQHALENSAEPVIEEIRERHLKVVHELLTEESAGKSVAFIEARIQELNIICQGIHMLQELSDRSMARVLSFGELVSSFIVAEALNNKMGDVERIDPRTLIITDDELLKANVQWEETTKRIKNRFDKIYHTVVIPGFISSTEQGITSTLGRGGSDFTASIFAAALDISELHIYSDVSGMLTANPKFVSTAENIEHLTYNEAFELSHFGAKVLYPPAIQPAYEKQIPVLLKNTFEPHHPGTRIDDIVEEKMNTISGLSSIDNVAMVNLTGIGMVGVSGYSSRVFSALHRSDINVVMIAQSCSERGICVAIAEHDLASAKQTLEKEFSEEINRGRIDPIKPEANLSIVALVGDGMKYKSGVSGAIFSKLGHADINIRAIAQGSSESNISIIIEAADEKKAVAVLHEAYFENQPTKVLLFIAGVGNVGSEFLSILKDQEVAIQQNNKIRFEVRGVMNSRKMILSDEHISIDNILTALNESEDVSNLQQMFDFMHGISAPNIVFVDNTASPATADYYLKCVENNIHVVTCNKIVASGPLTIYDQIMANSDAGPARFYNETNVGAALPIIQTLSGMVASGDRIHRIQAVLSGSLNYIYDGYDGTSDFADVVSQAGDLGFTEPNPMTDLSGVDVQRKIVILARVIGMQVDMADVDLQADMPKESYQAEKREDVLRILKEHESSFKNKLSEANARGHKLKYIAEIRDYKLTVGLQSIDSDHIFYQLKGTDNMVAINSDRYPDRPLVIQGAGAGAANTASGVMTDILRIDYIR